MSKHRYSKFDAAGRLGVSMSTIRRMIQRGELETERDGPTRNDKIWVLLENHPGTLVGVPDDAPGSSDGTLGTPSDGQADASRDPPAGQPDPHGTPANGTLGTPDGIPVDPSGTPAGVPGSPTEVPGTPGGAPDLATEVIILRQQVRHLEELGTYREERLKEVERLAEERADRLKDSEWRYHELVKQVTSTMEQVTRALPPANGTEKQARKRSWWPLRRRSAA